MTVTDYHESYHDHYLMSEITMGASPALSHTQPPSSLPAVLVMPPALIIITGHHSVIMIIIIT